VLGLQADGQAVVGHEPVVGCGRQLQLQAEMAVANRFTLPAGLQASGAELPDGLQQPVAGLPVIVRHHQATYRPSR
jgi:hypothetical protein